MYPFADALKLAAAAMTIPMLGMGVIMIHLLRRINKDKQNTQNTTQEKPANSPGSIK